MQYDVNVKRHVVWVLTVLLLCNRWALAEGCRLQVGHFEGFDSLSNLEKSDRFFDDSCLIQILSDFDDQGIALPGSDGSPGKGDSFFTADSNAISLARVVFRVNGGERFHYDGTFLLDTMLSADRLPDHRLFIRVWNAPNFAAATSYWDSPLYDLLPGPQQVAFSRDRWTGHDFHPNATSRLLESAKRNSSLLPHDSSLSVYPNPFNAETQIHFALPNDAHVRIIIYDVLGRAVAILQNETLKAGDHSIRFNAASLSSGIYFMSLMADHQTQLTQRVMLIR
jgi:hypothetical protein